MIWPPAPRPDDGPSSTARSCAAHPVTSVATTRGRRWSRRAELSPLETQTALQLHLQADFPTEREESDILQAWRWRESMSLSDAWYAALALRLSATWVTTDRRAAGTARRHGVDVRLLA